MLTLSKALIMRSDIQKSSKWMLDTACTAHMRNDRSTFRIYQAKYN